MFEGFVFDTLEHCDISPNNIARYVKFLVALLGIDKDKVTSLSTSAKRYNLCLVGGFGVGTVTHCDPFENHLASATAEYQKLGNAAMRKRLADISSSSASRMLDDLDGVDVKQLDSFCDPWEASHGNAESSDGKDSTAKPSLILLLTNDCETPEILPGVAVGTVKKNDKVHFFLGHHVGLVTSGVDHELRRPRIVGAVVCAKRQNNVGTSDPSTRQTSRYWTLYTESELVATASRLQLSLSRGEILNMFH